MAAPRGAWPCWRCPRRERARLQMRSDPRLHEGLEPGAGSPLRAHSALDGVCRQSISDSWLGNLRECLAHLV